VSKLSVVIPTYRRGPVLLDTIRYLLEMPERLQEILIVDQTEELPPAIEEFFQWLETGRAGFSNDWKKYAEKFQALETGILRRIVLSEPSIPHAMNTGLQEAKGEIVLFLDDDIIPDENLIRAHLETYEKFPEARAVVGQVLQPEDGFQVSEVRGQRSETSLSAVALTSVEGSRAEIKGSKAEEDRGLRTEDRGQKTEDGRQKTEDRGRRSDAATNEQRTTNNKLKSGLRRNLNFRFNSTEPAWVENVMAGNLSVKKEFALRVGGFDENFIPPVSFRFETELAKRLVAAGGRIRFAPAASIRHLRAGQGGTRSRGSHLTSASPIHGVGDVYYALRCGKGAERIRYILKRPFREVCSTFHLKHPWYIPVKLIGELRAIVMAFRLNQKGPMLLAKSRRIVLIDTAQVDRPDGSMVRYRAMLRDALEAHADCVVEDLNLSPTQAWLDRFPVLLQTPFRYLCIALNARRLLPKQKGAVLHLLDGSHAYLLASVRTLSCPLVITVHDLIPTLCERGELKGVRPGKGARWILRRSVAALSRADWIAAVSENTRRDVCRIASVDPKHTGVVHSAVSVPCGSAPAQKVDLPYILHVAGNNNFYKNRPGVVEIFKMIRQSVPVQLKLAGAPPDEALQKQIDASGVADNVAFCTHVSEEELSALYRDAAFLLFPSFYEGFGWPPLEAMALGCPVLCSDAGSLAEIAGDAAWTAAPGETEKFALYAIRLLREPEERQRRVDAGLQHAKTFSMKAMGEGFAEVYRLADAVFCQKTEATQ
jgi:glycosyltransferase involved in cell wall biosynthesis/GT2 family glycosyltransferase